MEKIYSISTFQQLSSKTFKEHKDLKSGAAAVLDYTLGLPGEVGEVSEIIKHYIFHNQEFTDDTKMKLAKELGDIVWYVSAVATLFNIPMEAVLALNTAKLRHRYGEHYNDTDSAQRREKEEKFEQTEEYKAILANILEGIKHEIE